MKRVKPSPVIRVIHCVCSSMLLNYKERRYTLCLQFRGGGCSRCGRALCPQVSACVHREGNAVGSK